jgi:hypothetical protein
MRRFFISWCFALLAIVTVDAQQIAVVKGSVTNVYDTLKDAIEGAEGGSVLYLPGGSFPIPDEVKITKLLYIIGIGHDAQSDNADGRTLISGQLCFESGSDGSLVMGCYITGNVNIGTAETPVHQIVVKYCNLNSIQVNHADCLRTGVNQNYLRNVSNCNFASVDFTNNIMHSIIQVGGGYICYNILVHNYEVHWQYALPLYKVNSAIIKDNIILASYDTWDIYEGNDCQIIGNMLNQNWGDNCINVQANWADVLLNPEGITLASNYHFKEAYKEYENKVGIYAGKGFSDSGLPRVPYITEKDIPGQTDASGKLNIKIKVKAGE